MRVALVVNRLEDYALPLVTGLAATLNRHGASLLVLINPAARTGSEAWLRRLVRAGTIHAVVVTSVVDPQSGESVVDELIEQACGVPVVTTGVAGHGVPDVSCDNASGAVAAARHLLGSGRRRALLVAGPVDNPDSAEREQAFIEVFTAARDQPDQPDRPVLPGAVVQVVRADFSREVAYRRTLEQLERVRAGGGAPVDAVFAANDEMALGALDALTVRGLRCPEDIAVVGFDNTDAGAVAGPPLTSIDQQLHEQGERAAGLVLAQLAHREVPDRVRTATQLVVRASSTQASPIGAASAEEVALLRAGRAELSTTRQLLALHQGLLNATSQEELGQELRAVLPRTGVRRAFMARTEADAAELVFTWGAPDVLIGRQRYDPELLMPSAHRCELDRGTLVVHQLVRGDQELGLLLYEQEVLDRWTGQALQQGLTSSLAVIARTRELAAHNAQLEALVASRTAQLQAEVTSRRAAQEQLQKANGTLRAALLVDALTGVLNRAAFDDALQRAWESHEVTGEPLSVLMCDVDLFKRYNDSAGHLAGDSCLRAVASRIAEAVRGRDDVVARFGGEEFAVILPRTGAAGAAAVAERVLGLVRAAGLPHPGCEPGTTVSLSVGVATSAAPLSSVSAQEVLRCADAALYRAKADGRDRMSAAGPAPGAAARAVVLGGPLRGAARTRS